MSQALEQAEKKLLAHGLFSHAIIIYNQPLPFYAI